MYVGSVAEQKGISKEVGYIYIYWLYLRLIFWLPTTVIEHSLEYSTYQSGIFDSPPPRVRMKNIFALVAFCLTGLQYHVFFSALRCSTVLSIYKSGPRYGYDVYRVLYKPECILQIESLFLAILLQCWIDIHNFIRAS